MQLIPSMSMEIAKDKMQNTNKYQNTKSKISNSFEFRYLAFDFCLVFLYLNFGISKLMILNRLY